MKTVLRVAIFMAVLLGSQQTKAQTYCEYLFGFAWCDATWAIDDITIGSFSQQNSGCNAGGAYTNQTSITISAVKGAATPFTLGSGSVAVQWAIWVDLNADGDFTDATDYFWGTSSPSATVSGTMVIPAATVPGSTRIRIASRDQSAAIVKADACNFGFGAETQDFTLLMQVAGGCNIPTNLAASTLATSALLSWDSVGTLYNVEYGLQGFVQGAGTTVNSTTHTKTITGLTPNTYYQFYVRNNCTGGVGGTSSWMGPFSFRTQCLAVSVFPYTETFNNSPWAANVGWNYASDTISPCWDRFPLYAWNYSWLVRTGNTPNNPNTGPNAGFGGSGNYLYVESNGGAGDEAFMTSAQYNTNALTAPWLTFQYHMFGSTMGNLYTQVSTNGGQTWVTIDSLVGQQQLSSASAWLERGLDVTAYKGTNFMFRFKALHKGGYSNGNMAIDQITLGEAPPCKKASGFAITNITGSQAQASWTNSAPTYYLELGPIGFIQGTGNIDTVNASGSHVFTGLNGNSYYDVFIKTDCSVGGNGTSAWAGPYTFRTLLRPDWEEDFNINGFTPNDRWLSAQGTLANPTVFTSTYSSWYENGWLNNGWTGAIRGTFGQWNTMQDWFFTEQIDLGNTHNFELYFDMAATNGGTSGPAVLQPDDSVLVVISTNGGLTWNKTNTIFTATAASNITNTGGTYTVDLSAYSGIVKIGFYLQSTVYNVNAVDIFIDNIGMRVPAACPAPTALNSSTITANSLTLSWTGNSKSVTYQVEYGPKGFVQGTGTFINGLTTTSTPVTNLNPVTQYDFYVMAECAADTSLVTGPLTVLTGCPAIFATPYFENFEALSAGDPPINGKWDNCWTSSNPTGNKFRWNAGSGAYSWASSGPSADHTTGIAEAGIYMYTQSNYNPGYDATLINGPFNLSTLTTPTLSFWYHMYGSDMGDLHVDVSKDQVNWINDVYVKLGQQQLSSTDPWIKIQASLSQFINDTVYIRIRGIKGGSNSDMAIDDVSITNAIGCVPPGGLTTTNATTTTATLNWASYATQQTIEWGPAGFYQGTGTGTVVFGISGTSYLLSGLSPNTAYDYYVKDTCKANSWVGPFTFSTDCPGPLAGVYTVGGTPGPSNFVTLKDAFRSLENCGISASVTLNLTGGNNGKNLRLGAIPGASATKTVTINGTGTDTIFGNGQDYALELNGAAYVKFNAIYFDNYAGIQVIWMHNNTHHVVIDSCHIQGNNLGSPFYGTANIAGSLVSNSSLEQGQNAHHISITNNTIDGGTCAIMFLGDEQSHTKGYVIKNNIISNADEFGIRFEHADSIVVHENYMNGTLNTYQGNGLSIGYGNHFDIRKNFFAAKTTALSIYYSNSSGVSSNSTIANNMLIGLNNGSALQLTSTSYANLYFNSLLSGGTALLIYANSNTDHYNFRNNIMHSKTGFAMDNGSFEGSDFVLDYNVYHTEGSQFVYDSTSYIDLASWKLGKPSANVHSLQGDVFFATADDLHIIGTLPNNVGVAIPGITTDYDGNIRPAAGSTIVDIGADEFTPKINDIALTAIVDPKTGCGDSTTTVTLRIRNYGTATATNIPLHVEITGGITASLNYTYTGSLANLAYVNVNVGSFNSYTGGNNLVIKAYSSLVADQDASNDTLINTNTFFIPQQPFYYAPTKVCYSTTDSTVLGAPNYSGVNYAWYATSTDTVPVSTNDSITVPISGQPTWYLSYGENVQDSLQSVGFSAPWSGQGGVMFNLTAKTNVVLDSFDLNAGINAGDTSMLIVHYIPYGTFIGNETNPAAWTTFDTVHIIGAGIQNRTIAILNNPLYIPTNAQYAIYLEYNAAFDYSAAAGLPINTPLLTFVGGAGLFGSFANAYSNNLFEGIIHSHSVSCSDTRVPVALNINSDTAFASFTTAVTQPNKVDVNATASVGQLITWDFGDGNSASGTIASHIYTNGGNYTILCTVQDTVCNTVDTATFSTNLTIGVTENSLSRSLNIFPNPSTGVFNLLFDVAFGEDVNITVLDALGRTLSTESFSNAEGSITRQLDLSNQARGLYFVHISVGKNTAVKKITKL